MCNLERSISFFFMEFPISIPIQKFKDIKTPFYFYDTAVLRKTLDLLTNEAQKYKNYKIHYAIKANPNPKLLNIIKQYGIGIDIVSGNEILTAIRNGFNPNEILFAGVGKTDDEIGVAIDNGIYCFNVESLQEIDVINEIASSKNKIVNICIRVNPNICAHTHHHITTGLYENKFGICSRDLEKAILNINSYPHLRFLGFHFHIGSQLLDLSDFEKLVLFIHDLLELYRSKGINVKILDVGGGLGVSYTNPNLLPDFEKYFKIFSSLSPKVEEIHFELGRSIICQCGSLVTKLLYIKQGMERNFAIVDGGMTELIRPALYNAFHLVENVTHPGNDYEFDVVGPVCESSDVIAHSVKMGDAKRGNYVIIRSAGAYGESMASSYLCRDIPLGYISEEFQDN